MNNFNINVNGQQFQNLSSGDKIVLLEAAIVQDNIVITQIQSNLTKAQATLTTHQTALTALQAPQS